jgi:hypothetical protein
MKLYIEMNMADLIVKVVQATNPDGHSEQLRVLTMIGNSTRKASRVSSTTRINRISTGAGTIADHGHDWPQLERHSTTGRSDMMGHRHLSRPKPCYALDQLDDDDDNDDLESGNDSSTNYSSETAPRL